MIWGEGIRIEGVELLDRTRLHPAGTLVIAFTPPGAEEIRAAMSRVKPQKVILLPANPAGDDPRRPAESDERSNSRWHHRGESSPWMSWPGCWVSGRESSDWHWSTCRLPAGWISQWTQSGGLALSKGDGIPHGDVASIEKRLRIALGETTAFRRHFASAPVATFSVIIFSYSD